MTASDRRFPEPAPERRVFANRTLKMRSIRAVGYDMDYTLTQYKAEAFEGFAFSGASRRLAELGWPVEALSFDPASTARGLVVDLDLGNLVKATRFGWVVRARHGGRFMEQAEVRSAYLGTHIDISEDRYVLLNSLFSLSEASLFAHGVDLLDAGMLPGGMGYREMFAAIVDSVDRVHQDGSLKEGVLADPGRFISLDGDIVASLLDQRASGKRLMLITNSEWSYTNEIMTHTFDPFLRGGDKWRDLFEIVVVSASKPGFFTSSNPLYRVVDEDRGLLEPHFGPLGSGGVFYGGNAQLLEESLGLTGDEILYVGDHLYGDVHYSKALRRWRTALILQELEAEISALAEFKPTQARLSELIDRRQELETQLGAQRLARLRAAEGHADPLGPSEDHLASISRIEAELSQLDKLMAPLKDQASRLQNQGWGTLARAKQDKSLFFRQIERYADIYTSRVSNLLFPGPYATFRMGRLPLPHDPGS
jgi:HAD superfamily 5'-nucleotidase-like hydrolase